MELFFRPPILPDEERTQKARLLHAVLWLGMLAVTIFVSGKLLIEPGYTLRWLLTIVIIDIICLAMVVLNRRGYTRLASFGLIISLGLIFTLLAATAGGLRAPAMTAYFVLVPLAGLLLGGKSAIYAGFGFAFAGVALLVAGETGILPTGVNTVTPILLLASFLLYMVMTVAAQYLSTRTIEDALARARQEIVERKKIEASLRLSEARLRAYIDVAPVAMTWYRPDGTGEFANRKALDLFGYSFEEIPNPTVWFQKAYPDKAYRDRVIANWNAMVSEAQRSGKEISPIDVTFTRKDGSSRFVEISGAVVEDRIVVTFDDLTGRKRAEDELRESEQRYREVFETTTNCIFLVDVTPDRRFIFNAFNPAEKDVTGLTEDVYGKTTDEALPPELARSVSANYLRCVEEGKPVHYEEHLDLPAGARDFKTTLLPVRDSRGRIYRIIGISDDITEDKRAEIEHRERLARAEMLARVSQALADASLDYQGALEVIARQATEEIGDTCAVFLLSEDRKRLTLATVQHLDTEAESFSRSLAASSSNELGKGVLGRVVQTGHSVVIDEVPPEQVPLLMRPVMADFQKHLGIGTLMAVPMRAQGTTVGVLGLIRHQAGHPYSAEDQALVQELADRAALAITNARLYAENIRQAEALRQANADLERRIAERTAELTDLYDHAPCGYESLDSEGRFVRINETGLKMYGYSREELIGKRYVDIVSPNYVEVFNTGLNQVVEQGSTRNSECEVIRKDGSRLIILVSATAERDAAGRFVRTRATVIDNTLRKQAEAQIHRLNDELVARAQKLEMINKELESFTYTVSHDLKAPLRGINGYSQLALEGYADRLDEEGRFFLNSIRNASIQMGQLIDDLLVYSRLERRPMENELIDLKSFVEELLSQFMDEIQARHIALTVSLPSIALQIDPDGLGLVLRNILDNAIKYTRQTASPAVEIGAEKQDHRCLVWVKDNGIGFDMRFHDRIFEIFQRLEPDGDYPGTGIGLALVRKACQRMGAKVWAKSKPGEGATFFLEIPW